MTPRKVRIAADSADERDKKEQTHRGRNTEKNNH
jgi:hypothetical protein